jgi:hypothetical protein
MACKINGIAEMAGTFLVEKVETKLRGKLLSFVPLRNGMLLR